MLVNTCADNSFFLLSSKFFWGQGSHCCTHFTRHLRHRTSGEHQAELLGSFFLVCRALSPLSSPSLMLAILSYFPAAQLMPQVSLWRATARPLWFDSSHAKMLAELSWQLPWLLQSQRVRAW